VSHITLFAPNNYGNLRNVWAFADQRGGDFFMIRRREFIAGLGGAAAWPLLARAQQPALPAVGYLSAASRIPTAESSFLRGLSEIGYVEGRNVAIEYRWAEGQYNRLPTMAADLVNRRVAAIAAMPSPAALVAKAATTTIPIVFAVGADPVQDGLVTSLNHPGGNLTGSSFFTVALTAKRLELLLEVAPKTNVVALLLNPIFVNAEHEQREVLAATSALGRKLRVSSAGTDSGIDTAFANLAQEGVGALLLGNDPFFFTRRRQLMSLAARYAIPTIYPLRAYATDGGLLSYGTDPNDASRIQGNYVGRILKGEKPGDLPIQLPTKFELVVNLQTAKAMGLTIPESFLLRADELIE
jgi:putative tryptophan/tyrosine transport system substrate-binding protein